MILKKRDIDIYRKANSVDIISARQIYIYIDKDNDSYGGWIEIGTDSDRYTCLTL